MKKNNSKTTFSICLVSTLLCYLWFYWVTPSSLPISPFSTAGCFRHYNRVNNLLEYAHNLQFSFRFQDLYFSFALLWKWRILLKLIRILELCHTRANFTLVTLKQKKKCSAESKEKCFPPVRCPSKRSNQSTLRSNPSLTLPYNLLLPSSFFSPQTTPHICYTPNSHTPSLQSCTIKTKHFLIICSFLKVNSYCSQKYQRSRR